jgi:glutamate-1-semialdehyde 2,1-aminomutase
LGKIIGGGLPLAAFGGKAEIMDLLAPGGQVYQAGTLSGNPIATAAANATLELLGQGGCYERLDTAAARLEAGLSQAAADSGACVAINRVGSIMSCFFTDQPVRNFADVQTTDIAAFKRFFAAMLERGVYLAPSAYEAMFVSLAHADEDIERTIHAAGESFKACL